MPENSRKLRRGWATERAPAPTPLPFCYTRECLMVCLESHKLPTTWVDLLKLVRGCIRMTSGPSIEKTISLHTDPHPFPQTHTPFPWISNLSLQTAPHHHRPALPSHRVGPIDLYPFPGTICWGGRVLEPASASSVNTFQPPQVF